MRRSTLVLGGARSGKRAYAEGLAGTHKGEKLYIATAESIDAEMTGRIKHHQVRRGSSWQTIEAPLDLVSVLRASDAADRFILIDCVTVWINNLMFRQRATEAEIAALCSAISSVRGRVVVVSNEVGSGIVPDNALARAFRDEAGRANQALAAAADEVVLVVAGLPLTLKPAKPG
jgi:adenosylcobinamide kinase/adenosylcobinamide-phosphate guanylyltransferase